MENENNNYCPYEEFISQITDNENDFYRIYLYKRKENTNKYAYIQKFESVCPDLDEVKAKYGGGDYSAHFSFKKDGKWSNTTKNFSIYEEMVKNDNELIKILLPLVINNKKSAIDEFDIINKILSQNILNYNSLMKTITQKKDDDNDYEEVEEVNMPDDLTFNIIEQFIPTIVGPDMANNLKKIMSNPIVGNIIKSFLNDKLNLNKIINYLNNKIGSESTAQILKCLVEYK